MEKLAAEGDLPKGHGRQQRWESAHGRSHVLSAEWLDLRALTEYACVSDRTIRSWLHLAVNALPSYRVRGKILVKRREFDLWLERHRTKARSNANIGALVEEIVGEIRGR